MAPDETRYTLDDLRNDVASGLADPARGPVRPAAAGAGPADPAAILGKVDAALHEFGPVLVGLTPAQYKALVAAVIGMIDLLDKRVNPA